MKSKQSNVFHFFTVNLSPVTIALSVIIATPAMAVDSSWVGTAGDNIYNTATNWTPATAPVNHGDSATWNGSQTGPLSILWNGNIAPFPGLGAGFFLTSGQTAAVTLNTANSSQMGLREINIAAGAGAFTLGGATGNFNCTLRTTGQITTLLNNSTGDANTATIKPNVTWLNGGGSANRTLIFDGDGNWRAENAVAVTNAFALAIIKNGSGTTTITNANISQNFSYTINAGTLKVSGTGLLGGPIVGSTQTFSGTVAIVGGTLAYESSNSQAISSAISGAGALTQSSGTLTLTGVSTRTGPTTVTGGTMILGGAGSSAASGLTINGASAKFVQTSSVASTVPITLTQGILDGTGSVGAVTVNGSGGILKNGNGGTGALTAGSLSFSSAGSINFAEDGVTTTPGVIVTGALVATGGITVNASQTTWASDTTYDLMTYGSLTGGSGNFTVGTITGKSTRQNATLNVGANKVTITITGDNPVWTGLDNGNWAIGSTGANGNWKTTAGQTNYIAGDTVLFDDSVTTGTTAVTIPANISPALASFNNSTKDYTVSGAFGIAAGSVIKAGTGQLTISTANTYNGGTTVSAGTLALSGAGTLGATTNALTVNGSGVVNLGATSQTLGAVSLSGTGTIANGTFSPLTLNATSDSNLVVSAATAGGGSLVKAGSGSLTLSGANSHTGGTTVTSGTLLISGTGKLGATTVPVSVGAATLDLGGTAHTVGPVTLSAAGTISNGTLSFSVFNDNHTAGTATVSAKLTGIGALNMNGGGGTTILTAANDYTGPTFITSGAMLVLGNGGTTGSLSPVGDITLGNGARFSTSRSDTVTQGEHFGLLTGNTNGRLELTGTGTTVLNLANTFTAGGNITAGTVVAASNQALGTGAGGFFNLTGGSLRLTNNITVPIGIAPHGEAAASDTVGSIVSTGTNVLSGAINFNNAGTGTITNIISLSGTLTANGALAANASGRTFNFGGAGDVVVVGAITGDVAVSKSGPGTTTLVNASGNDYIGGTTIQDGTLRILGTNAGPTTIDGTGAVLAGTGTISGDVTLTNGGIAPGNGDTPIGTLSLNNDLFLSPTASKFNFDLSSADNSSDLLILNAIYNGGGTVTFNFTGGVVGQTYTLLQFATTDLTPSNASAFLVTGGTGTFTISGADLKYTVTTVAGAGGYASWSTTNAGGQASNLDFDLDGVSNGVEYFMGQTGSTFTANPGLVGGTISWPKDPAYVGTYAVQTSNNLVDWVPATPAPVVVGDTVQYTPGSGLGKIFARLQVTPN